MKSWVKHILLAILLSTFSTWVLVPYWHFRIEAFEFLLLKFLPINWYIAPVLARIILGLIYVLAWLQLCKLFSYKWLKFGAIVGFVLPFIFNPIYPKNFKDMGKIIDNPVPDAILKTISKSQNKTLVAFVSTTCRFCKLGAKKMYTADIQSNKKYGALLVSAGDPIDLNNFLAETQTAFPYTTISDSVFLEITEGHFPCFELIENGRFTKQWNAESFNYQALQYLQDTFNE